MEQSYYVLMPSVYINEPVVQTVRSQADDTNSVMFQTSFYTFLSLSVTSQKMFGNSQTFTSKNLHMKRLSNLLL